MSIFYGRKKQLLLSGLMLGVSQIGFATPAIPTISQWKLPETISKTEYFTVDWHMWWGENGNRWELFQNTTVIASGNLVANGSQAQQGAIRVNPTQSGTLDYYLALCNDSGCSASQAFQVLVTDGKDGDNENEEPSEPIDTTSAPGKAQIDWFAEQGDIGSQTITWHMYWGENANHWYLLENEAIIYDAKLTAKAKNAQSDSITFTQNEAGVYRYQVKLCKQYQGDSQCSVSTIKSRTLKDKSAPLVKPGQPQLESLPSVVTIEAQGDAEINIRWQMSSGTHGNRWKLLQNGVIVHHANLIANTEPAQKGTYLLTLNAAGSYNYTVQLCNQQETQAVCNISNTQSVVIKSNGNSEPDTGTIAKNNVYQQTSGKVISSYFVEWGIYGRNFHVSDIPASNLTHIQYGFLAICGNNPSAIAASAIAQECQTKQIHEVTIVDSFAALQKTYPGDIWRDEVTGSQYNGNFGQLKKLKERYPHLKILPSVGGWTQSDPFFDLAPVAESRTIFVNSVVRFLEKYDFFDGVDIDWEFPGGGGALNAAGGTQDTAAFTALMRELRLALDSLEIRTRREYQLTAAVGTGPEKIDFIDYAAVSQYMTYIFMMSYDYAGAWEKITGHHANLYPNQEYHPGFSADTAVQNFIAAGAPLAKLVLGGAFYGRGWAGVNNSHPHAPELFPLYGAASGAASGTWESGVYDYKDLYAHYIGNQGTGINGYQVVYDSIAQAPYLWNASKSEFISYENPRSITKKAEYVLAEELAGIMTWELDADNGLLLNAINDGLGNQKVNQ